MTTYRYYEVCPRGFANEVTYIRVPADRTGEVETHFEGEKDWQFNNGNTGYSDGWTTDKRAPRMAMDWDDYVAEFGA